MILEEMNWQLCWMDIGRNESSNFMSIKKKDQREDDLLNSNSAYRLLFSKSIGIAYSNKSDPSMCKEYTQTINDRFPI